MTRYTNRRAIPCTLNMAILDTKLSNEERGFRHLASTICSNELFGVLERFFCQLFTR